MSAQPRERNLRGSSAARSVPGRRPGEPCGLPIRSTNDDKIDANPIGRRD
ncbi:MAG: hypothetical protein ABI740_03735 [Alphaproteobacteria bacterium]